MCGIFATTRPDLWRDRSADVIAALRHRGPDSEGLWESPTAGALLIQTRLSIIGLGPEGYQPSVLPTTGLVMNGEIYNYRDLADPDQLAGPLSDTQVFHRRFDRDGTAACDRFRGMYAFAHWDEAARTFTIGRDPWGIKPLYVLQHPSGGVTVCSELPPLRLHPDAAEIDPVGFAQYLAFGHTGPDVTFFRNISKLPPGTTRRFLADGRVETRRIEQLQWFEGSDVDAAMADSVAAHFIADVEVGVFLSGGIDSTLLATYACEHSSSLKTFTIAFPDTPAIDESPLARHNSGLLGTEHHEVPVTVTDMVGALDRFLTCHGEPFGDPAALPLTVLSQTAARVVKVVLAGEGADEMFGGYRRYDVLGRLDHPLVNAAGRVTDPFAQAWYSRRGDSAKHRAVEAALRGGKANGLASLVDSDLFAIRRGGAGTMVAEQLKRDWRTAAEGVGSREAARRFDLTRWLPNTYLEKTDRATMAASLEARTPYLDPVVMHAARREGRAFGKDDLRSMLEARLPGVTLPTVKKGLATPLDRVLDSGLRSSLDGFFRSSGGRFAPLLRPADLQALQRRSARSRASAYRLAVLARWAELNPAP